ncbi:hypothetical protein HHI36_018523 [Cryptolaemus montrouzieri]|uniref:Uncharacterized protein n=1 Tax=Cryptolaemus montrouzieri TaxID=559131 RepID=A0ABD2P0E6_9CUCU
MNPSDNITQHVAKVESLAEQLKESENEEEGGDIENDDENVERLNEAGGRDLRPRNVIQPPRRFEEYELNFVKEDVPETYKEATESKEKEN